MLETQSEEMVKVQMRSGPERTTKEKGSGCREGSKRGNREMIE